MRNRDPATVPITSYEHISTARRTSGNWLSVRALATPNSINLVAGAPMPIVKIRASTILGEFEQAQTELLDKAVVLTDGICGTVDKIWLDELHGLRISIRGHDGKGAVPARKLAQRGRGRDRGHPNAAGR